MLGEEPSDDCNGSIFTVEQKVCINFTNENTEFSLSLYCSGDANYSFINGKKMFKFKTGNKNICFPTQFCLDNISKKFEVTESGKVSSKRNVYDFSVDYNAINKYVTYNIHKHLMIKSNLW